MNTPLTRKVIKYMLREPFHPAQKSASGEMVLKKSRSLLFIVIFAFLIMVPGTYFILTEGNEATDHLLGFNMMIGPVIVYLFIMIIDHLTYRINVDDTGITVKAFYGKKTVNYSEITSVGHTRFFGGRYLIHSSKGTLRIPENIRGAVDLITLLTEKTGEEQCNEALEVIRTRKADLRKWNA